MKLSRHAQEAVHEGMGHARRAKDVLRDSVDRAIQVFAQNR
jgi:hypothetical protein